MPTPVRRLLLISCLAAAALPVQARADELRVAAAASLTDAFTDIAQRFERVHTGVHVSLVFGGSGLLLQQIQQGQAVDVLATADQETMAQGVVRHLIDRASIRHFAGNQLVLIQPSGAPQPLRHLQDLAGPHIGRIAMGKVASVPAGRYAQQSLERAGLWGALRPRMVMADNVRQVLDQVVRGEADAGFVYRTDAQGAGSQVVVALALEDSHKPVRYPAGVVSSSPRKALAVEFIAFLASPASQAVLARLGFSPP